MASSLAEEAVDSCPPRCARRFFLRRPTAKIEKRVTKLGEDRTVRNDDVDQDRTRGRADALRSQSPA
jgi:hypothetical protein